MARGRSNEDVSILQMALVGYQFERQKIEDKIRELQKQLGGSKSPARPGAGAKKGTGVKRVLSPAARKRIATAQKKRWAEHRRRQASAAKSE